MHAYCCQRDRPHPHTDQLLNHVVDCVAATRPCTLFAEYPRAPTSFDQGFVKITYGRLAKAIDHMAHWLVDEFGRGRDFETLAYIGPNDLRYPALVLGSIKAGYKMLMLSPRNSVAAQLHLMKAAQCTKLLAPSQRPPAVTAILADSQASYIVARDVPSVQDLLQTKCPQFAYKKTLADAASDPFLVMHTSGTTGLPKLVTWPQAFIPAHAKQWNLEAPAGMESMDHLYKGNRAWLPFPPFHAAFAAQVYVNAMCNQTSMIFPLSGAIPSAAQLSQALKHVSVDAALLPPSLVEEMSYSPEVLDHISANIDSVVFAGGDVPRECGDRVSKKVELMAFYGTTEFGSLPFIQHVGRSETSDDWKYLTIHPDCSAEFRRQVDDMYELVLVRKPETERHLAVFTTFPALTEYHTKDLFAPHPTKPNLWTHRGRVDDIIVFSTGEKTNPITFEQTVFARHSEISGVILVGAKRFQAALLVELTDAKRLSREEKEKLLDLVWPSVELANHDCPAHAKVQRSHVWFTDPERPMSRSSKGTIQRAATLKEYDQDFDAWYKQADGLSSDLTPHAGVDVQDTSAVLACVRRALNHAAGRPFEDGENFFAAGMDSLQALTLSRSLKVSLEDPAFNVSTIYAAPSIQQLVYTIQNREVASVAKPDASRQNVIESTLAGLSKQIDKLTPSVSAEHCQDRHRQILLTGSTGSLGSQILNDLLLRSDVSHVFCLNRAQDGGLAQQLSRRREAGFQADFHPDRVSFLCADLARQDLGLPQATLERMSANVDLYIHNAWPVNFNTALSSFEPHLHGVINLIRTASAACMKPEVIFLSSVSAVSSLHNDRIPEDIVKDVSAPATTGYGESKYVAERLLKHASDYLDLTVKILRLGQVAGPIGPNGAAWNQREWVPSLVRSSSYIGTMPEALPGMLGNVDWVPIDILSQVVLELSTAHSDAVSLDSGRNGIAIAAFDRCMVYNILNQHAVSWSSIAPAVSSALPSRPKLVEFSAWLEAVEAKLVDDSKAGSSGLAHALDQNPAAKLLGFFQNCLMEAPRPKPAWEAKAAVSTSPTLRKSEGIKGEWLQRWMRQWLD